MTDIRVILIRTIGLVAGFLLTVGALTIIAIVRPQDGSETTTVVTVLTQIALGSAGALGALGIAEAITLTISGQSQPPQNVEQNQPQQSNETQHVP